MQAEIAKLKAELRRTTEEHANGFGAGRADNGGVAKETQRLGHHSFGSGQPIWQR